MKERHLWRTVAYRTRWGVVPCQCEPSRREHALFRELIPDWLARVLYSFVNDLG